MSQNGQKKEGPRGKPAGKTKKKEKEKRKEKPLEFALNSPQASIIPLNPHNGGVSIQLNFGLILWKHLFIFDSGGIVKIKNKKIKNKKR